MRQGDHRMDRKHRFLCMRDILEHLGDCFDEWEQANSRDERFLAETIERDLDQFRRLCNSLRQDARSSTPRRQAALV
jgi:hypothetical protein